MTRALIQKPSFPSLRLGSVALLLLLPAACGSVEAARGHDQVAALVAERSGGARTRWEAGPPAEAQIADWVRALVADGLTRRGAIEIALVNNPGLKETYERLGISQADMVQAGLLRNPTFGLDLGFGSGTTRELRGSVVQDFLDVFVLGRRKEIAREQFLTDTLRVAHQALETAADVSKAFVDVQTREALVEKRRLVLATLGAGTTLMERRFAAGNATELEHAEEQARLAEARLDLGREELELVERRERLNRLLGLAGAASAWTIREPLAEPTAADPALGDLETAALKQRLDVAAATGQALLLTKATALARSTRAAAWTSASTRTAIPTVRACWVPTSSSSCRSSISDRRRSRASKPASARRSGASRGSSGTSGPKCGWRGRAWPPPARSSPTIRRRCCRCVAMSSS